MKKLMIAFTFLILLSTPLSLKAESSKKTPEIEHRLDTQEVRNLSGEQGFPETCKIPVSRYLAILLMSAGVVIYLK